MWHSLCSRRSPSRMGLLSSVVGLLALTSGGCVLESRYNALLYEHNQLKAQMQASQVQAGAEREGMRQEMMARDAQCGIVANERNALQARLSEEQRRSAEIRSKLETMMPVLNYILSTLTPPPAQMITAPPTATLPPGRPM